MPRPTVAFVCVHNSCRSQIAEAWSKKLAGDVYDSCSAGTHPADAINRDAVRLMRERHGIDMTQTQHPKLLVDIRPPDILITMGCGVECPYMPCKHREDWGLDDPSGQTDAVFLDIIERIEKRVVLLREAIENGQISI